MGLWDLHIIAFYFYIDFTQHPNFFGIGVALPILQYVSLEQVEKEHLHNSTQRNLDKGFNHSINPPDEGTWSLCRTCVGEGPGRSCQQRERVFGYLHRTARHIQTIGLLYLYRMVLLCTRSMWVPLIRESFVLNKRSFLYCNIALWSFLSFPYVNMTLFGSIGDLHSWSHWAQEWLQSVYWQSLVTVSHTSRWAHALLGVTGEH